MSGYLPHKIKLGKSQVMKMARALHHGGEVRIRLAHHAMHGPHAVHLTKMQLRKMEKKHSMGMGVELRMSHKQLRHMHGHGLFDFLGPIVRSVAAPLAQQALSGVVNKVLGHGRKRRGHGFGSFLKGIASKVGSVAAPLAQDLAKKGAELALNKGKDLALNALKSKLGGGRKRRVGRPRGSGLVSPGGGLYAPGGAVRHYRKHSKRGAGIIDDVLGSIF